MEFSNNDRIQPANPLVGCRLDTLDWVNNSIFRLNAVISAAFFAVTVTEVAFPGFRIRGHIKRRIYAEQSTETRIGDGLNKKGAQDEHPFEIVVSD